MTALVIAEERFTIVTAFYYVLRTLHLRILSAVTSRRLVASLFSILAVYAHPNASTSGLKAQGMR